MATMYIPGSVIIEENLTVGGTQKSTDRSSLTQDNLQSYWLPWYGWRVHDAPQTTLPNPSANDDLGVYSNTFGTGSVAIETYDVKTVGATTLYALTWFQLPPEYVATETVTFRAKAGMVGAVADTSCTLDLEAYKIDKFGSIGSDLCTTAATTINSLTEANKDFTINPASLSAGDVLELRIAVAVNDAAGGTSVAARIGCAEFLIDIKG